MSHLWEMEVINDTIDFYHGEKVGVGLVLASKIYHKAAEKIAEGKFTVKGEMPVEKNLIAEYFKNPEMKESILKENEVNVLDAIDTNKFFDKKKEIVEIIRAIPTAEELTDMISQVEGVKSLADLGFDESYQEKTAKLSPYVRRRLTFMRALKFFDFYEEVISC